MNKEKFYFWAVSLLLIFIVVFPTVTGFIQVLSSSSVSVSEDVQSFFNTLVYLKGIPTAMVMSVGLVETILIQACLFLGFVVILNYILFPVVRFLKSMLRMHFGMQSKELTFEESRYLKYKMLASAPMVVFFVYIYTLLIVFMYGDWGKVMSEKGDMFQMFSVVSASLFCLLILTLFLGGLYWWVSRRSSGLRKALGKRAFFFSFYYLGILPLYVGVSMIPALLLEVTTL